MKLNLKKYLLKFWSFTGLFALTGVIVPVILNVVWRYYSNVLSEHYYDNPQHQYFFPHQGQYESILTTVTTILWPSSILELGEAPGNESRTFANSLLANVVLYLVVGIFIWLGIKKHKAFFAIPALVLIPVWGWLLSLR